MKQLTLVLLLLLSATTMSAQQRKSLSILGDSYSTFENYLQPDSNFVWYFQGKHENTDVTRVEQTWWSLLLNKTGMKLCQNNSFSGSTISSTGYNGEDYSERSFCRRLWNLGCPDIIIVLGATNDSWAGSPIGEYKYADWTKQDLYSFRPAMAYMLYHLKNRYPNTEIYFVMNSELKEEITTSCRTLCERYGVPFIQLENIDKVNGHPSIKGMEAIAEQIRENIKN
ncbi:MAG: SGNH/GDSL hydrolase family protein [Prevotella sp.]